MSADNHNVGRPTAITPAVVAKLAEALKLDVTVEEACLYAGISKDTYYRKLKEDEAFSDEMEQSRMYVTMLARRSVITHMEKDGALALKYLERKRRDEFSLQYRQSPEMQKIDLAAEARARLSPETLAAIAKYEHDPETVATATAQR